MSTTNAALTQSGDAQRVQIAQKSASVAQLEQQVSDLRGDLREAQDEVEDARGQRAAAIERVATVEALRAKDLARIAELEAQLSDHQAQIDELEAADELEVGIGDAGKIEGLRLNGNDVLHDSETRVKVGADTLYLGDTVTEPVHERRDGSIVSSGEFPGDNAIIYWTITSTVIPSTNWHVNRWEFKSDEAFGDVALGIYADLDIGQYTGHNGLIVGGTAHPNRLLITDRPTPRRVSL